MAYPRYQFERCRRDAGTESRIRCREPVAIAQRLAIRRRCHWLRGSPISLDGLAYDTCLARHPRDVALCEGPRQAYELALR